MSWFIRALVARATRLSLAIAAIEAAAGSAMVWLEYQRRLEQPEFKALVESHGMTAFVGESIDRSKAEEWFQEIGSQVIPYWHWFDLGTGIAVLALGLLLISFLLGQSQRHERKWILSTRMMVASVVGGSIAVTVAIVAIAVQQVERGLVPVYGDSLGAIAMGLPALLVMSIVLLLAMNFILLRLKAGSSFDMLLRTWTVLGTLRNLAIALILAAFLAVIALLIQHAYSSLAAVLLIFALLCVLCRDELPLTESQNQ